MGEVYAGYSGLIVANGELRSMVWGFPLALKGKSGRPLKPKPVNNTRTDKLKSFMWRSSFEKRRCLIAVSAFAEAEGEKGAKRRTWFALPDTDVFAVAGILRDTAEWGPAYSMVMT
jgi:putative SOS response-associated peptidase YedK